MPRTERAYCIDRQISRVSVPYVEVGVTPLEAALGKDRLGQRVHAHRALLTVEVVAQHDGPPLHRRGEASVEVEARPQGGISGLELRDVLQLRLSEPVEDVDARARIALCPYHVERHELHALALEELVEELRHEIAAPGPATHLAEALFIDVEDDDAVVAPARHRHREPRVVHDVVQLGDEADALDAQRIAYEEQHDRKAKPDPYEVLFQDGPFRPSGKIPS